MVHLKLTLIVEDSNVLNLTEHPKIPAKPSGETSFNVAEIVYI